MDTEIYLKTFDTDVIDNAIKNLKQEGISIEFSGGFDPKDQSGFLPVTVKIEDSCKYEYLKELFGEDEMETGFEADIRVEAQETDEEGLPELVTSLLSQSTVTVTLAADGDEELAAMFIFAYGVCKDDKAIMFDTYEGEHLLANKIMRRLSDYLND
jgi:hypothetical protein